ncbi:MAG: hypothetical protein ACR2OO_16760 [Thermomicrobiales bacterium]
MTERQPVPPDALLAAFDDIAARIADGSYLRPDVGRRSPDEIEAAARRDLARRLDVEAEALRSGRSPLLSAAAALLAALDVDGRAMGMGVRAACDALLPHAWESAATKRTARKVRKVYESEWARLERLPAAELAELCAAAVASLTEAAHAAA